MAAPVVETCHVACGANGTPHVLSWSRRGLVAFGTCHSVALYDPQVKRPLQVTQKMAFLAHKRALPTISHFKKKESQFISVDCNSRVEDAAEIHLPLNLISLSVLFIMHETCFPLSSPPPAEILKQASASPARPRLIPCPSHSSPDGELWLASCAQDCLIRVWRLFAKLQGGREDKAEAALRLKEDVFEVTENGTTSLYAMTLETVLAGHENWVYGIHWQPSYIKDETVHQPLSLLSASMDKTMILWGPEDASGVWVEQAEWSPAVIVSGHFDAVQDLSWDPEGDYIVTVGLDQTTRLFTPWRRKGWAQPTWHEISRPQIHGYDMQCLAMVGRFQFVSGADEKVLRVFRAPRNFVENFANIAGRPLEELDMPEGASTPALGLSNKAVFQGDLVSQKSEDNAEDSSRVSDQYKESYFQPLSLNEPPPEDHLLQNTLWPEIQKLYGHGFEMFCLASDSTRTVVASACKASKAEHASILLWSSSSWKQLQSLPCHSLTVTQMSFSPDARLLLAVSRDRTWSLWKREDPPSGNPLFSLYTHTKKETAVHARIIWSCDWSADNKYFVTSSRDKKVIVWGHGASGDPVGEGAVAIGPCSSVLDVGDSATAVAFCPFPCADHSYLLAVGLEGGRILLYKWRPMAEPSAASDWTRCGQTDDSQSHSLAVKRLRWRSRPGLAGQQGAELDHSWVQLASAGVDHALKIFNVHLQAL
uniref:Elongator complex protein 2 n=1 Tax=Denticeps clupeoides TaxID=299321 RepID=A0AAY4EPG8_9TELE